MTVAYTEAVVRSEANNMLPLDKALGKIDAQEFKSLHYDTRSETGSWEELVSEAG